jgi:hypothetical protein
MTEEGDPTLEINLFTQNIPVCSAIHVLDIPVNLPVSALIGIRQVLLEGLKQVDINSDLRSIFVGVDKNNESTASVLYTALQDAPHANAFFDRWDELHAVLFEYSIKSRHNTLIACAQGFWANGSWIKLDIVPKPIITIVEPEA